jgi:hypothetical protein
MRFLLHAGLSQGRLGQEASSLSLGGGEHTPRADTTKAIHQHARRTHRRYAVRTC